MFFRKKSAIERELRSIRNSAIRTIFLVVTLVSGVAPALCMWLDFRGGVPYQLESLWDVALRTYPLTISVAIIAMSRQLGWFRYGRVFFMGAVITAGAGLGDLTASISGNESATVSAANAVSVPDSWLFAPLVNSLNYLVGYYHLYGARHFFASILVGSFAGRTASRLVRHLPERERIRRYLRDVAEGNADLPELPSLDEVTGSQNDRRAA